MRYSHKFIIHLEELDHMIDDEALRLEIEQSGYIEPILLPERFNANEWWNEHMNEIQSDETDRWEALIQLLADSVEDEAESLFL